MKSEDLLAVVQQRITAAILENNWSAPKEAAPRQVFTKTGMQNCAPCRQSPAQPIFGILPAETWITMQRLAEDTMKLCSHLPSDIDLIVAVARSGLMPASIIAQMLHVPLYTTGGSAVHKPSPIVPCGHGWRLESTEIPQSVKHVLVVDDTASNGHTARVIRPHVQAAWPDAKITFAVIYSSSKAARHVDLMAYLYEQPHYLEWNLFNAGHGENLITDLDGILCTDCPAGMDDDGERYIHWMRNVKPIQWPRRRPIPLIVTARLEKYRAITEEWLARHGIRYQQLVMGPWKTKQERNEDWPNNVVRHKAAAAQLVPAYLFVESDPVLAEALSKIIPMPVLCPALGRVLHPTRTRARASASASGSGPGTELKKILGRFGIHSTSGCKCDDRAAIMDRNGPQWCRENIETIVDWMEEEAKKRSLPFSRLIAKGAVLMAIRRSEKNNRSA